ncbi:FkbM family methyltransferase [Pelagibacteraceae bacterium]|nr:FkbM family methyltransferase [Pelagibacteraceae bacterium]
MRKISFFIYKIIKSIDLIFVKLLNRSFLLWFADFINEDQYSSVDICEKKTYFFTPNQTIKWRVDTLFTKEPETIEWINSFDKKKKIIFWDIGSNIGLYSIYAAQMYNDIDIVSFEPSTSNLRILSRNISVNNLVEKIKINQLPLGEKQNTNLIMHESEFIEGWSMNTFGDPIDHQGKKFKSKQSYSIFGNNINFYIENKILDFPNYIKIDVDGLEHKILKGGNKCLENEKLESISIELNENYIEQFEEVTRIMKEHNFLIKQKKHAKMFDKSELFSNTYNYIFERK